ncbi:MAG: transposase, partial [Epibacterium sp.]|nr:transposase [Epibacterium sp.]
MPKPQSGSGSLEVRPGKCIWQAKTREDAQQALGLFNATFGVNYPMAIKCLIRDPETLLEFFDFPSQHWQSIRMSNPIENVFARVHQRTTRTNGGLSKGVML